MDTREWFDGVLTAAARAAVAEPPEVRTWVVCDGDVDPEWYVYMYGSMCVYIVNQLAG